MKNLTFTKKMFFISYIGTIVFFVSTFLTNAQTSSSLNLSIDPLYAIYTETNEGHSIHIAFVIINSGQSEATVVTENFDSAIYGIDADTNSLKYALSFPEPLKYKDKYTTIPSIYKYCPVALKSGETAIINFYQDMPKAKAINYKSWRKEFLQAENMIITYEVPSAWNKRFDLWEGKLISPPVKFTKRISDSNK